METLLYYIWQKQHYRALTPVGSLSGSAVEVIDPGIRNTDAGPDFFNAKIRIDGLLWVGNVEIHAKSSEWYVHGHQHDRNYDNCILHVVLKQDRPVFTASGVEIPACEIEVAPEMYDMAALLSQGVGELPCACRLKDLNSMQQHGWMDRLLVERLERKAGDVRKFYEMSDGEWSQTFYILLTRYFGFRVNNDPMERLARSLPLRILQKHRSSLFQLEALLLGQAGFLSDVDETAADYVIQLRDEYLFLKHKFGLEPLPSNAFRLHRIRPVASPHRRLAQLAAIWHHAEWIGDACLKSNYPEDLKPLFMPEVSDFWQSHYSLFGPAGETGPEKGRISENSYHLILINVVAPYLYAYAQERKIPLLAEKAVKLFELLPPENNRIIRLFRKAGVEVNSAADSQALIQLMDGYCTSGKCFFCHWGISLFSLKK